jgi:hypothetical protein
VQNGYNAALIQAPRFSEPPQNLARAKRIAARECQRQAKTSPSALP